MNKQPAFRPHDFPAPETVWNSPALSGAPSPCFIVSEALLERNLSILRSVQERTGVKILLALKGFAMWSVFPLLRTVLNGVCASSPHEARLGREEFGREVHVFAAAYSASDIDELLPLADHLLFNSFSQWRRFKDQAERRSRPVECGLRLNPEHSEGAAAIYDPCAPGSRLGIRHKDFVSGVERYGLDGISGLHFHTLCEQNSDALERTLDVVEKKFGQWFSRIKWLNFGGGHHITRADYDLERLCRCIERIQEKYGLQVYLEPGEAVALDTGVLKSTVLDVAPSDMPIAILDASAAAHMPDVLEMPYRPNVIGAGDAAPGPDAGPGASPDAGGPPAGTKAWTCRLAGKSCLAGDVIGEYSFDEPLRPGDALYFLDMAHYSMVKTNTFNGLGLPGIAILKKDGVLELVRQFGYEDFKTRLS